MKKAIMIGLLFVMCSITTWGTTTKDIDTSEPTTSNQVKESNTPSQTQGSLESSDIPNEALLKDDSTRPSYALDYNQFGLNTYNYDEQKILDKIEQKATGVVEGGISIVEYLAMLSGLVSLVLIMVGIFSRGFKWVIIGIVGLLIDLIIYSLVGNWPLIFVHFKNQFWS